MEKNNVVPSVKPAARIPLVKNNLRFLACAELDQKAQDLIASAFPSTQFTYQGNPADIANPHKVSAAIRGLSEVHIYTTLTATGPKRVIDVGGNPRRGQNRAHLAGCNYHACCPILSAQDVIREDKRRTYQNLSNGSIQYCNHKWQECACQDADVAIMIDSIYYFTPHDLVRCLLTTREKAAYVAYHHFEEDGEFSIPHHSLPEGIARVKDGLVTMKMKGATRSYSHPVFHWPSGYKTVVVEGRVWTLIEEELKACGTYKVSKIILTPGFVGDEVDERLLVEYHPLTNEMVATKNLTKEMVEVRVARYLVRNPGAGNVRTLTKKILRELSILGELDGRQYVTYSFFDYLKDALLDCLPSLPNCSWRDAVAPDPQMDWATFQNYQNSRNFECTLRSDVPPQTRSTVPDDALPPLMHGQLLPRPFTNPKTKDWCRVSGIDGYRPPRPAREENNYLQALSTRVGKLPDRFDKATTAFLLSAKVWEALQVNMMTFDQWVSSYYGQRHSRNKVAAYRKAVEDLSIKPNTGSTLFIDGFIKDELYAGKTEDFKTRLVMNCSDLKQIVRPAVFVSSLAQAIKLSQNTNDPIVYSGGFNPEQLGEWFENFNLPGWYAVENDFSAFEGSISSCVLDAEFSFYASKGCPKEILADFYRQKKVKVELPVGTYTRTGTRMSGVPNTSVGNSWVNASLHKAILDAHGYVPGADYAMIVQGDDNLILCRPEVAELLGSTDLFKQHGFNAEIKVHEDPYNSEFCSCRFLPVDGKTLFCPKPGRLLAKGLEVPWNCDTFSYLKPVMNHYYNTSPSSMIRYYAYAWLRNCGVPVKPPPLNPSELAFYGISAQDYAQLFPETTGPILIIPNNGVVENILEKDCPLDHGAITRDHAEVVYSAPSKPKCNIKHELTQYLERARAAKLSFDSLEVWEDFNEILF